MTKTFKITIGILILLALAAGGVWGIRSKRIQNESQEQIVVEKQDKEMGNEIIKEKEKEPSRNIYFAQGSKGSYSFVDVFSKEVKEILPTDYEIVDQHSYPTYPDFLLLRKNNQLFFFEVDNKKIEKILIDSLKDSEIIHLDTSISDKSKFYLVISDTAEEEGLYGFDIIGQRTYFYSAKDNKIQNADKVKLPGISEFMGCHQYDSEYSRFFIWPCGEGVGSALPLSVYNLITWEQKEVMLPTELKNMGLRYNDGYFFAIGNLSDIPNVIVINPNNEEITKELYTISPEVMIKLKELDKNYNSGLRPYSTLLVEQKDTIVIGGADFILLLKFNKDKEIIDSAYFSDEDSYVNFIFTDGERIYYNNGIRDNNIRVINIDKKELKKITIPSEKNGEEVSLFLLQDK